ncbi:hypothetical protein V9T40_012659 [Parthenolecanium corni]|uniref:Uncharacterized protein n=1 Tax=Parthenolecanium corni TaxID=536013 RepID=A0AAN9T7N0_9HEMI
MWRFSFEIPSSSGNRFVWFPPVRLFTEPIRLASKIGSYLHECLASPCLFPKQNLELRKDWSLFSKDEINYSSSSISVPFLCEKHFDPKFVFKKEKKQCSMDTQSQVPNNQSGVLILKLVKLCCNKYLNPRQRETIRGNPRQCEAIRGNSRQCEEIRGSARQSEAGRGSARQGEAVRGNPRQGEAIRGSARQSEAGRGNPRQGEAIRGRARQCEAGRGSARQSEAGRGNPRQREAIRGSARQSEAARGNPRQREAIRGSARQSEAARGNPRQREAIRGRARQSEADCSITCDLLGA